MIGRPQAKRSKISESTKTVEFIYFAPQAKKVQLVGTFNGWNSETVPMKKDRKGDWKAELELAPGRHEYRFIVDGNWSNDQKQVESVPNAFGSWNCVIEV